MQGRDRGGGILGPMTNIKAVISGHNKKVLQEQKEDNGRKCNCRNGDDCPLNGQCLTPEVLYEATVTSDIPRYEDRTYKGITERFWKERYKEHKKTFTHRKYENDSELSKEIWKVKDKGGILKVSWKILRKQRPTTQIQRSACYVSP